MTDYPSHIGGVISQITIRSGTTYTWGGRLYPSDIPPFLRFADDDLKRRFLYGTLQAHLYQDFYCRSAPSALVKRDARLRASGARDYEVSLSRANAGRGYQSRGWALVCSDGKSATIRRDDLKLHVPSQLLIDLPSSFQPDAPVAVNMPKEFFGLSPGYYVAAGNAELQGEKVTDWTRVYFNITPSGAIEFVRQATRRLNRSSLAYNLKVLNNPARYDRSDTVVLYVDRGDFGAVASVLAEMLPRVADECRSGVPALTKELARGVGVAENPSAGESFGQHRCGLLADGIIRAYERGARSTADRMTAIADSFAEAGIRLEAPFLNHCSQDIYQLPKGRRHTPRDAMRVKGRRTEDCDDGRYRHTAESIGRHIVQSAIWHDDRCNWIGVNYQPDPLTPGSFLQTYETLGSAVYGGTSGVALFLAELTYVSGESAFRKAALGAIRQALQQVAQREHGNAFGLYDGRLGVAFAVARAALLLDEKDLLDGALRSAELTVGDEATEAEADLLSGTAGAIVALLGLYYIVGKRGLLSRAARLGATLIAAATRSADGYSWAARVTPRQRHLTGLSHGAAGIGYALVELYAATAEARFKQAADKAFAYERAAFDAERGNWPDYRGVLETKVRTRPIVPCGTAWCHGAPGIALSRIRAHEVLGGHGYDSEALVALNTTRDTLLRRQDLETGNFSLCHGLCGNAEVLLQGRRLPQWDHEDAIRLVTRFADHGRARYARNGTWPCGSGRGETPGLMLGLAGIGSFYLHLHNPKLPSLAMLSPLFRYSSPP